MSVLQRFDTHTQMLHSQRLDRVEVFVTQIIEVTFHVDVAAHVEHFMHVVQYLGQAMFQHGGRGTPADVQGRHRTAARQCPRRNQFPA